MRSLNDLNDMKIVLASSNKNKIAELSTILTSVLGEGIEVITIKEAGITDEIIEDGSTFAENALIKARTAAKSGMIGIGDDSGLTVDALDGAPGIFSARYAGEHGNDALNNQKLLSDMNDKDDRRASFVCCIACVFPDGREEIVSHGYIHGEILREARGEGGFGYDPLFYVKEIGKTLAEVEASEKNLVSHRANALKAFAEEFKKSLSNQSIID